MSEIKVINRLSIEKKGNSTLYKFPTIEDYFKQNLIGIDKLDWDAIVNKLGDTYETIADHNTSLDEALSGLDPQTLTYTINLDSRGDLVYNQGKTDEATFLTSGHIASLISEALAGLQPQDLTDYAKQTDLNSLAASYSSLLQTVNSNYNTLNSKFEGYSKTNHTHAWTSLTGVRESPTGYLELTNGQQPTKYIELLSNTQKLTVTSVPSNCNAFVTEYNGKILLVAEAASGYTFEKWTSSGNLLSTNPIHIITKTSTTPTAFLANFKVEQQQEVTRTINITVNGEGSVQVRKVSDNSVVTGSVPDGTYVNIVATPASGKKFTSWTNSNLPESLINTSTIENYAVTENLYATANFAAKTSYGYTIAVSPNDSTVRSLVVNTIGSGQSVLEGETFTIKVNDTDPTDYEFVGWTSSQEELQPGVRTFTSNNAGPTTTPILKATGATTFTANYLKYYSINTQIKDASGNVITGATVGIELVSGKAANNKYSSGSKVNLTAPSVSGYQFIKWSDQDTSMIKGPLTVNDNISVYPIYGKTYTISFAAQPSAYGTVSAHKVNTNGTTGDAISNGQALLTGTKIKLTATPSNGYQFTSWEVEDNAGTVNSNNEITIGNRNLRITANFEATEKGFVHIVRYNGADYELIPYTDVLYMGTALLANPIEITETTTFNKDNYTVDTYTFDGWYDYNHQLQDAERITVDPGQTYYGVFAQKRTITAETNNEDYGTVSGGNTTYNATQSCTLTAQPNANYQFEGWYEKSGNTYSKIEGETSTTYTFIVSTNRTIRANFIPKKYTVTVTASPTAGGAVHIGSSTGETSLDVDYGSKPKLYAQANSTYVFSGWKKNNGNIISGSNVAEYTVTTAITANTTFTAVFTKQYTINVNVPSDQSTIGLAKIVSGTTAPTTSSGSSVTITSGTKFTAKAFINSAQQAAYSFDKWTNNVDSTNNTNVQFTGTAAKDITYTASFKINQVTITASASPTNGGTVDPTSETVNYGSSLTIRAYPNNGFNFIKWQKDGVDIEGGLELQLSNITSGATYTAIFEQEAAPQYYYYTSTNRTDINPSIANSTPLNLDQVVSVSAKRVLVFLVPNSASNIQIQQQILNGFEDVTDTFISDSTSVDGYVKYYVQGTVDPLTGAGTYLNGDYKLVQGS